MGSRKNRWNTNPIFVNRMSLRSASASALTSRCSNTNAPLDGVSTQPRRCSNVDLPQPDGPQMATESDRPTRSDTSRTAITGPAAIGNTLVISRASTTGEFDAASTGIKR